jgi:hypothetical protein
MKIAKMLSLFGSRIEKDVKKHHLSIYCMDDDFLKQISVLEKKLGK